jgi:peptidoglycan/LPS O-acetylase OafA/YrhL
MRTPADHRIAYLDGMRCLAVVGVVLFHYFVRWAPQLNQQSLYPYGGLWSRVHLFGGGRFGVELFFMISGFVITLTLERCPNWREFAARRYARLAPAMLLFSALTFIAVRTLPHSPFHPDLWAFIPSFTFIDPRLLNLIFSTDRFSDIDGAYWSLFVEVKYYLIAGAIYYCRRRTFVSNMLLTSTLMVLGLLLVDSSAPTLSAWYELLLIPEFIPWFVIGIGLYLHYCGAAPVRWLGIVAGGLLQLLLLRYGHDHYLGGTWGLAIPALLTAFFLMAMHSAALQRLLQLKLLVTVGISSYGLYLLHQHFGVAVIHALPRYFSIHPAAGIAMALLTMLGCAAVAYASFILIETPATQALLQLFLGRHRTAGVSR